MNERFKLTRTELSWILYDIGNSAFTMMVSTLIPIYFNYLGDKAGISSTDYLAYWGYAASIATLIVAVIGPVFGTMADQKNYKKPIFMIALAVGAIGCALLGFIQSWLAFLIVFIIARVGYSSSLVFYDAMLTEVTTPERMDRVSSYGFGWGYIGSCIPFGVCLVLALCYESIGISFQTAMILDFLIIAVWWVGTTVPLLKNFHQTHYVEAQTHPVRDTFRRLGDTFAHIRREKHIFLFLLAFFFFIDGVYTIIDMATAYGTALGLDTTGLLLALLVTQFVAFPFSLLFGRLASKYPTGRLIKICIVAYTCITIFALFMSTQLHFWILAVCVGMFQGGIQALSRSYFGKIIPPEQSGEYFGIYDICGKGASFIGTTLVGVMTQVSGSANVGVGSLVVIFIIGIIVFHHADKLNAQKI